MTLHSMIARGDPYTQPARALARPSRHQEEVEMDLRRAKDNAPASSGKRRQPVIDVWHRMVRPGLKLTGRVFRGPGSTWRGAVMDGAPGIFCYYLARVSDCWSPQQVEDLLKQQPFVGNVVRDPA